MTLRSAFRELISDDDGLLSTGRLIALIGAVQGSELCHIGLALAFIYPNSNIGITIIGIGAGFYTGGALLKFGQKVQETRVITMPQIDGHQIPPGA